MDKYGFLDSQKICLKRLRKNIYLDGQDYRYHLKDKIKIKMFISHINQADQMMISDPS